VELHLALSVAAIWAAAVAHQVGADWSSAIRSSRLRRSFTRARQGWPRA